MTSSLSAVPAERRRRAAATLLGFAALLVAIGVVACTAPGSSHHSVATVVFAVVAFAAAAVVAAMGWGVSHSIRLDAAADTIDEAISDAIASAGMACSCGHDHDPDELHFTDGADESLHRTGTHSPACSHDGAGDACAHDCSTCVLASLRA